jgi:hypothetical protein
VVDAPGRSGLKVLTHWSGTEGFCHSFDPVGGETRLFGPKSQLVELNGGCAGTRTPDLLPITLLHTRFQKFHRVFPAIIFSDNLGSRLPPPPIN